MNELTNQLAEAIKNNNLEEVKELLSQGANINGEDEDGKTPLGIALFGANIEMTEFLLFRAAEKAYPNQPNKDGVTPLSSVAYFLDYGLGVGGSSFAPARLQMIKEALISGGEKRGDINRLQIDELREKAATKWGECIKLLIKSILMKNLAETKPDFIQKNEEFSVYWDKQVEVEEEAKLKISNLAEKTLPDEFSPFKKDFLASSSSIQFFSVLNIEAIQNDISKQEQSNTHHHLN